MRSFNIKSDKMRRWLRFACFGILMLWIYPITQHHDLLVPLFFVMVLAYLCGALDNG